MFLRFAVPKLCEDIKNESLELKQYPWKVTVKDFILSKVASQQSATLLENKLFSFFKKFPNF